MAHILCDEDGSVVSFGLCAGDLPPLMSSKTSVIMNDLPVVEEKDEISLEQMLGLPEAESEAEPAPTKKRPPLEDLDGNARKKNRAANIIIGDYEPIGPFKHPEDATVCVCGWKANLALKGQPREFGCSKCDRIWKRKVNGLAWNNHLKICPGAERTARWIPPEPTQNP
ncbi:hypothetical protein PG984_011228 [Apiospora sp. TS-2023a]